jgi:hypothetical protein
MAEIKAKKKRAEEEAARVDAEWNARLKLSQDAIAKMNDISDLSTYDLPEIGIKSLREYQDIEHYKDKGLDSLLL